jgi:hypothetical protein
MGNSSNELKHCAKERKDRQTCEKALKIQFKF